MWRRTAAFGLLLLILLTRDGPIPRGSNLLTLTVNVYNSTVSPIRAASFKCIRLTLGVGPPAMKLHQPLTGAAEILFEYGEQVPVIDTHEHVPRTESLYIATPIRFGDLFVPYITGDLSSAGMALPKDAVDFHRIDDDWDAFGPAWAAVRYGSYARALRIALQRFYGVDDLTRENHREIVERINANRGPGIYHRIFREACRIERAILCASELPEPGDPILAGNIVSPSMIAISRTGIELIAKDVGASEVKTLDELVEASDRWMELQVAKGAVEFKTWTVPIESPDRARAEESLQHVLRGEDGPIERVFDLGTYIREANARKAAQLGVPMAIHTGVLRDFRGVDVRHLIGFITRNPDTRMDIYHFGIPSVRACIQVVKNFSNAYLNLCWAHIVASDMVTASLKEAIDMVPVNKVFAFGADYVTFIETVYGHLYIARENVAIALGDRVDRCLMDLDDAKEILKAWFYDNPKRFYGL